MGLSAFIIMQPHEVPRGTWIKLGIDLFEHNKRQYLLIMDYFSKFPFIHKLHSLSTGTVINELKGLFSENGIPEVIISNGGPQFRSEFRNFAQEWGFQHIKCSPYHYQSNGEAESFVRTVKDTLTKAHQWPRPRHGITVIQINTNQLQTTIASRINELQETQNTFTHTKNAQTKGGGERRVNEFKMKAGTILQQIGTNITRTQCKYESVYSTTTTF